LSGAAFIVTHSGIGFPNGSASTLRVRGYASILSSLGYEVTVICSTFSELTEEGAENLAARGSEDGIDFWYPGGSTVRCRGFARRRLRSLGSWYRLLRAVFSRRPALVLTYPMTLSASLMLLPATHLVGGLFLSDLSELPEMQTGDRIGLALRLGVNMSGFKRSDGVVVISQSLVNQLAKSTDARRLMLMPVIMDSRDFLPRRPLQTERKNTLFYAGRLNDAKDGVGTLLEAFRLVHEVRPLTRLVLVGEPRTAVVDEYRERARALGILDSTEFKGVVERRAMLDEMRAASVLVTARPDTPQNRANMPTKLLEYLAAGRPVVATAVGNACDLVEHSETGLLVDSSDAEAIATAVLWVFEHEDEARSMAEAGSDFVLSRFDYRGYVDEFGEFIARLQCLMRPPIR
jgi:glycosyltransferase involved in cell wall biosynthesis